MQLSNIVCVYAIIQYAINSTIFLLNGWNGIVFLKFYAINQYMQLSNMQLSDTVCIPVLHC